MRRSGVADWVVLVTVFQPILDHLAPAMLVVFRITGLMIFAPVLGARAVPVRIKIGLAVLIGLAIYPLLSETVLEPSTLRLDLWALAPLMGMELMIGLVIGYVASLPLMALQTGGLIMGQQMGLGFARFFNPAIGDDADVVGQVLFFLALAAFLMIGGHEAMLIALLHSFEHVPLGAFVPDATLLDLILGFLLSAFELAIRVATPLLAIVFVESVAMGFLAKTVPQLNILSLGFPIRIMSGLAIIAIGLSVIDGLLMDELNFVADETLAWIQSLSAGEGT